MKDKSLYAPNGVKINKNVSKKQTILFEDLQEADIFARQNRSYSYPVFQKGVCICYGVPK